MLSRASSAVSKRVAVSGDVMTALPALRRGGREYYALDVTSKTAPKFMWKVTNATSGFGELGYTFSEPAFTKLGSTDVFVVGAVYDTYFDDPSHTSANGSAPMGSATTARW